MVATSRYWDPDSGTMVDTWRVLRSISGPAVDVGRVLVMFDGVGERGCEGVLGCQG